MSGIALLVGLLILSYLGSILVGGRAIRGYGLPSGVEYVLLGFVVGPNVLGVLDRATLAVFDPVAVVAVGWLAFVMGVEYGRTPEHTIPVRPMIASVALTTFVAVGVGLVVAGFTWAITSANRSETLLLAAGAGAVSAETTRHAVRWLVERHGARGPLAEMLFDVAGASELVPLIILAFLLPFERGFHMKYPLPIWVIGVITIVLGCLLGALCALLVGRDVHGIESWSVVLGAALFGTGVSMRVGLSALCMMFLLGLVLAATARERQMLKSRLARTERPVLLPTLLLAGAHIEPKLPLKIWIIIGATVVARLLLKWISALGLRALVPPVPRLAPGVGLGLVPAGALTLSIGLMLAVRWPGWVGQTLLVMAACHALLGELVGPPSLRRTLRAAGALRETQIESPVPTTQPAHSDAENA